MGFFDWLFKPAPVLPAQRLPILRYPGALPDDRPQAATDKDFLLKEIVAATDSVQWREKKDSELRVFGSQDQDQQSSCVANAGRKALRVVYKVNHNMDLDFSSSHLYRRRSNYPDGGMALDDLFRIMREGTTLYQLAPSDGQTEAQVNALKLEPYQEEVGKVFKIGNSVTLPIGDIDTVASVIEKTRKAVVLFYYFTSAEWSPLMPQIINPNLVLRDEATLRHGVCAVDYTLRNGVKTLVIDDSAHFGGRDRRFVTETFHKKRNFNAGYPINFAFDGTPDKPQHYFAEDIVYGAVSMEVMWLQRCLQANGTFPSNTVVNPATPANYFGLTANAVLTFQKKYNIAPVDELDALAGKKVGPATRAKLNELFA